MTSDKNVVPEWWWAVQIGLLIFLLPIGLIMLILTGAIYLGHWLES